MPSTIARNEVEKGTDAPDVDINQNLTSSPASNLSAREVMVDVAEWWIRELLKGDEVDHFEVLETILPHLSPLPSQSELATQFRALALWHEVLANGKLGGDFAVLQDKLLLLSAFFQKSPAYEECMTLFKVHQQLTILHATLTSEQATSAQIQTAVASYREALSAIFLGRTLPGELLQLVVDSEGYPTVCQRLEHLVAQPPPSIFGFTYLRDLVQSFLVNFVESKFRTPTLVRLGYRPSARKNNSDLPSGSAEVPTCDQKEQEEDSPTIEVGGREQEQNSGPQIGPSSSNRTLPDEEATDGQAQKDSTHSEFSFDGGEEEEEENAGPNTTRLYRRKSRSSSGRTPERASKRRRPNEERQPSSDLIDSSAMDQENDNVDQASANERQTRRALTPIQSNRRSPRSAMDSPQNQGLSPRQPHPEAEQTQGMSHTTSRRQQKLAALRARKEWAQQKSIENERLRLAVLAKQPPRKRLPYSKLENQAIQEGVSRFGCQWARIKAEYPSVLRARSVLNISDRAKILVKLDKLDSSLLQGPRGE